MDLLTSLGAAILLLLLICALMYGLLWAIAFLPWPAYMTAC